MTTVRPLLVLLLLACACLTGQAWAADSKPKLNSVKGVIDSIDVTNTKLVVKSDPKNPAKSKTILLNVDKTTQITIDKKPAVFSDLKEQDAVSASYSQGVASTISVTRDAAAATEPKPKK
jgi:hypothetical protein